MTNTVRSQPAAAIPRRRGRGGIVLALATAASAVVVLVGAGPLILRLVAGLFLVICVPVLLVNAKIGWPESTKPHESLLYSLALVVLGLMVGGLAINEVLPLVGVARPLDRLPVVVTLLIALAGLAAWRRERWRWFDGLRLESRTVTYPAIGIRDQLILVVGAVVVVGSVAGPIRLNNGAGGGVTTAMLIAAGVVIVGLFSWRRVLNGLTIAITIYQLSLALLLMTSLRGWFVTGHDIQREFRVFEMASGQGVWDIETFRSTYNACLSITILPTIIERTTGIPDVCVLKVVFQLLYALCPVLIYLIARRFASKSVAVLAAVYFIAFPTFFIDMPFLVRQEVAFFFLGATLLLITNSEWPIRTRRIGLVIFGTGVMLSHYSTMYVLLGVLTLAWMLTGADRVVRRLLRKRHERHGHSRRRRVITQSPTVLNWIVILTLAVLTILWSGPLTRTSGQVEETFSSTFTSFTGKHAAELRSSVTSYSIFGGSKPTPEALLKFYAGTSVERTQKGRENQENYSLSEIVKYPISIVPPEKLPLTGLGNAAEQLGVNVSTIDGLLRDGAAKVLQLFIALGLVLVLLGRARGFWPSPEFVCGAAASIVAIALHVLLPNVSSDYGILRTFAQGLFWLAPFLAVGSIQAFSWLGRSTSMRVALAVAIVFFLLMTGVISQVFGGYRPQLHLNNSGQYYDNYYLNAQEVSAMNWLQSRVRVDPTVPVQSEASTARYALTGLPKYSDRGTDDDIFPTYIRTDGYVFLGYSVIQKDEAAFLFSGDLVTYHYPIAFLDNNKSLTYSSDGARVYR